MRPALGFGLVAVVVVAVGWLQSPADISAAEAVRAARGAFRSAGVDEARVDPDPRAGTYHPADGGAPLAVWRTSTDVPGGSVELWLAREDGEPVFLDDRSGDGAVQLLSDAQFEAIAQRYENPANDRQIRRNLALTTAAALVAATAVQWDLQRARLRRRRRVGGVRLSSSRRGVRAPTVVPAAPAAAVTSTGTVPARRAGRAVPLRAAPPRPDRPLRAQEIP